MPKTMDTNTTYANRKAGTSNQASRGVTSAPARRVLTFVLATLAFLSFAAFATPAQADTINVSGNASLAAALSAANPGDVIILADGTYAGFTMSRSGTADAHILIKAANMGGANIASGVIHLSQTSYVTLAGLTITTGGASQTVDGEWLRFAVWFDATQHCRLTRSVLKLAVQPKNLQWVLLG